MAIKKDKYGYFIFESVDPNDGVRLLVFSKTSEAKRFLDFFIDKDIPVRVTHGPVSEYILTREEKKYTDNGYKYVNSNDIENFLNGRTVFVPDKKFEVPEINYTYRTHFFTFENWNSREDDPNKKISWILFCTVKNCNALAKHCKKFFDIEILFKKVPPEIIKQKLETLISDGVKFLGDKEIKRIIKGSI